MKLQKEQLVPGRWYYVHIYHSNYHIQFEKFREDNDSIVVSSYYFENSLNDASVNWGYYKDIDTLEVATELPNGEKLLEISSYEIY